MRVSDYELTTLAAGLPPPDGDFDRVLTRMARELLAARKVIASSRVVVEWAEPVTDGDWTEYDAAQRDLREYDAIMRDAPVEVPHGECPYPVHKDRSIKACVEAGDCGCGARDDGTTREG